MTHVGLTTTSLQPTTEQLVAMCPAGCRVRSFTRLRDDDIQPGRTKQRDRQEQEGDTCGGCTGDSIGQLHLVPLGSVGWRHLGQNGDELASS